MLITYEHRRNLWGGNGANTPLSKMFVPTNNSFGYRVEEGQIKNLRENGGKGVSVY
jgi:hypothetical protein